MVRHSKNSITGNCIYYLVGLSDRVYFKRTSNINAVVFGVPNHREEKHYKLAFMITAQKNKFFYYGFLQQT